MDKKEMDKWLILLKVMDKLLKLPKSKGLKVMH